MRDRDEKGIGHREKIKSKEPPDFGFQISDSGISLRKMLRRFWISDFGLCEICSKFIKLQVKKSSPYLFENLLLLFVYIVKLY